MLPTQLGGTDAQAAQRGTPKPFVFGAPATAVITPHGLFYLILVTRWGGKYCDDRNSRTRKQVKKRL